MFNTLRISDISKAAKHARTPKGNRRIINKLFRAADESHLWPINNRFNVTERAIRWVQDVMKVTGQEYVGYEYAYMIECRISHIVNKGL